MEEALDLSSDRILNNNTSYVTTEVHAVCPTFFFLTLNKYHVTIINVRYTALKSLGVRNTKQ